MKSAFASRLSRLGIPEKSARVVVFSALFLLSVFVTLVVLLSRGSEAEGNTAPSMQRILDDFSGVPGRLSEDALTVQDFILPEGVRQDTDKPHLLRSPLRRWTEEQVDRYWIPLEEIARDLIRRQNDRRIEELFEGIP